MKLRLDGGSLRLRLGRENVVRLAEEGSVEETLPFGPGPGERLSFVLRVEPGVEAVGARYEEGRILVELPAPLAREWTGTDRIRLEGEQEVAPGRTIRILVEKDLPCRHVPGEEAAEPAGTGDTFDELL